MHCTQCSARPDATDFNWLARDVRHPRVVWDAGCALCISCTTTDVILYSAPFIDSNWRLIYRRLHGSFDVQATYSKVALLLFFISSAGRNVYLNFKISPRKRFHIWMDSKKADPFGGVDAVSLSLSLFALWPFSNHRRFIVKGRGCGEARVGTATCQLACPLYCRAFNRPWRRDFIRLPNKTV